MDIVNQIRLLWNRSSVFSQGVPLDSLTTGTSITSRVPYGIIQDLSAETALLTNGGPKIRTSACRLELHLPSILEAEKIQREAERVFSPKNQFYLKILQTDCLEIEDWRIVLELQLWETL